MVKISGEAAHKRRLAKLRGPEMLEGVTQALYLGASDIVTDAQISMTTGATSGRNHQPSAPGQPPKADTHVLANSGEAAIVEPLKVTASFNAPYATVHEFGGTIHHPGGTPYFIKDGQPVFVSKQGQGAFHHLPVTKPHTIEMPERPYLRPAAKRKRGAVLERVQAAVKAVVGASG